MNKWCWLWRRWLIKSGFWTMWQCYMCRNLYAGSMDRNNHMLRCEHSLFEARAPGASLSAVLRCAFIWVRKYVGAFTNSKSVQYQTILSINHWEFYTGHTWEPSPRSKLLEETSYKLLYNLCRDPWFCSMFLWTLPLTRMKQRHISHFLHLTYSGLYLISIIYLIILLWHLKWPSLWSGKYSRSRGATLIVVIGASLYTRKSACSLYSLEISAVADNDYPFLRLSGLLKSAWRANKSAKTVMTRSTLFKVSALRWSGNWVLNCVTSSIPWRAQNPVARGSNARSNSSVIT